MSDVLVLQLTMLFLIIIGAIVKKLKIVSPTGQKNINDLVIYLILPCNIVKSFMIDCNHDTFRQFERKSFLFRLLFSCLQNLHDS